MICCHHTVVIRLQARSFGATMKTLGIGELTQRVNTVTGYVFMGKMSCIYG